MNTHGITAKVTDEEYYFKPSVYTDDFGKYNATMDMKALIMYGNGDGNKNKYKYANYITDYKVPVYDAVWEAQGSGGYLELWGQMADKISSFISFDDAYENFLTSGDPNLPEYVDPSNPSFEQIANALDNIFVTWWRKDKLEKEARDLAAQYYALENSIYYFLMQSDKRSDFKADLRLIESREKNKFNFIGQYADDYLHAYSNKIDEVYNLNSSRDSYRKANTLDYSHVQEHQIDMIINRILREPKISFNW